MSKIELNQSDVRAKLEADEATTSAMLAAFNECQQECFSIQQSIENAASQLAAVWRSDSAAPTYQQALRDWQVGFGDVRRGLDMLNEAMHQYALSTRTTEDDNRMQAIGWASARWATNS
jgi:uncharacterized protein YukE